MDTMYYRYYTPSKTSMAMENHQFLIEDTSTHSCWFFQPVMLVFHGVDHVLCEVGKRIGGNLRSKRWNPLKSWKKKPSGLGNLTPKKINMSPKKGPFWKECSLPTVSFRGSTLSDRNYRKMFRTMGPWCEPAFFSRECWSVWLFKERVGKCDGKLLQRSMASLEISCNICILQVEPLKNYIKHVPLEKWNLEDDDFSGLLKGQTFIEGASWVRWWKLCKK